MSKIEKLVIAGSPFFFGMVLLIGGLIMRISGPEQRVYALMAICTGFICLSIASVCVILVKILEGKKD